MKQCAPAFSFLCQTRINGFMPIELVKIKAFVAHISPILMNTDTKRHKNVCLVVTDCTLVYLFIADQMHGYQSYGSRQSLRIFENMNSILLKLIVQINFHSIEIEKLFTNSTSSTSLRILTSNKYQIN